MRKRDLMIVVAGLLTAVLLSGYLLLGDVMATASWGLSFRQEGSAPVAPASQRELAKYDGPIWGIPLRRCCT